MTFLQLCQRLRSETGLPGTGPSSVVGQTADYGRIVQWISDAYEDIQDSRSDWWFLRDTFSFNCTIGQASYPKSTITNLANWKGDSLRVYLTTINDEQWLEYWDWSTFRDAHLRGANTNITGRPIDFAVDPDRNLVLWPIPDQAYTITGECYKNPYTMSVDTDTPVFDRFQMAIVWNALRRYAASISDPTLYAHGQKEYKVMLDRLLREQTPMIIPGKALA